MIVSDAFDVAAPLETVWALLKDVPRVAPCIPNAKVTEVVDERTFRAEIGLRAGPVSVSYKATIVIEEIDDAGYVFAMGVLGNEGKGRGDVTARVVSHAERRGAGTHVTLETNATMTGVIATVGGRLIEGVAKATTAKFAANLARVAAGET
jgi:carbon monoxide dehydrogenase subunit G